MLDLATDALAHVVEGVEVLRQRVVRLPLQLGLLTEPEEYNECVCVTMDFDFITLLL